VKTDVPAILLAEDNPNDVELTIEALDRHHLANRVTVAHDGVEAMEYLRREGAFSEREPGDPAVVLLDIKMPRKDGLEVLREIRGDSALRGLPVVILTSSREEQDLITSYAGRERLRGEARGLPQLHRGGRAPRRVLGAHQRAAAERGEVARRRHAE
jgi:Response regulators consisting of a CheY-like receiver domain and a winged-helix DNA-binding domain